MKLSRTALKELKARYLDILKKCAFLNAVIIAGSLSTTAHAGQVTDSATFIDNLANGVWSDANFTAEVTPSKITVPTTPGTNGGFFQNSGNITFKENTPYFLYNSASNGGAIYNNGSLTFETDVIFDTNTASTQGGAIYNNNGTITFKNGATLKNNTANGVKNDIYMNGGTINFGSNDNIGATHTYKEVLEGGISGTGTINKFTNTELDLTKADNSNFSGSFNQASGTTKANSDTFFQGENVISGGELITNGTNLNYKALIKENGSLSHTANTDSGGNYATKDLSTSNISIQGDADTNTSASLSFTNGNYQLSDMGSGTSEDAVSFTNANVDLSATATANSTTTYTGETYHFKDSTISMQNNVIDTVEFENLNLDNTTLGFDIKLNAQDGGLNLTSDKLVYTGGNTDMGVNIDLTKVNLIDGVLNSENLWTDASIDDLGATPITNSAQVLSGLKFNNDVSDTAFVATNMYQYKVAIDENGNSIKLSAVDFVDTVTLEKINQSNENSAFNMGIGDAPYTYVMQNDLGTTGQKNKTISGKDSTNTIIDATGPLGEGLNMFNLQDASTNLTVKDLSIQGAKNVLTANAGSATFENVKITGSKNATVMNNASQLTLNNVEIDRNVLNSGTLNATSGKISGTLQNTDGTATLTGTNLGSVSVTNGTVSISGVINSDDTIQNATISNNATVSANGTLNTNNVNINGSLTSAGTTTLTDSAVSGETLITNGTTTVQATAGATSTLNGKTTVQENATLVLNNAQTKEVTNQGNIQAQNSTLTEVINRSTLTAEGGEITSLVNERLENTTNPVSANLTGTDIRQTLSVNTGSVTLTGTDTDTVNVGGLTSVSEGATLQATKTQFSDVTNAGTFSSQESTIHNFSHNANNTATLTDTDITNALTLFGGKVELTGASDDKAIVSGSTTVNKNSILETQNVTLNDVTNWAQLNANNTTMDEVINKGTLTLNTGAINDLTNIEGTAHLTDTDVTDLTLVGGDITMSATAGNQSRILNELSINQKSTDVTSVLTLEATTDLNGNEIPSDITFAGNISGAKSTIKNKGANLVLDLATDETNTFTGTFEQTSGQTTSASEKFFAGTNNIFGGKVITSGKAFTYSANVKGNGNLTHTALADDNGNYSTKNLSNVKLIGDSIAGTVASIILNNGKYTLNSDASSGNAEDNFQFNNATVQIIPNSDVSFKGEKYVFNDSTIDIRGNGIRKVTFENLDLDNTTLAFDLKLTKQGEKLVLQSDKFAYTGQQALTINIDLAKINLIDASLVDGVWDASIKDNGLMTASGKIDVLSGNISFDKTTNEDSVFLATDVYQYTIATDNQSVYLTGINFTDDMSLNAVNVYQGRSAFNMSVGNGVSNYKVRSNLDQMGTGTKTISGKNLDATASVIDASGDGTGLTMFKMNNIDSNLNVQNLTIQGAKDVLNASNGSASFENVIVSGSASGSKMSIGENASLELSSFTSDQDIINAGNTTINNSSAVQHIENTGTLDATASTILSLDNQQGGNATLNTTNVTDSTLNAGELVATNTTFNDITNTGTLNATGGTINELINNGNTATIKNVTNLISATNNATLNLEGTTAQSVTNNKNLNLKSGTIQTLTNNTGGTTTMNNGTVTQLDNLGGTTTMNNGEIVTANNSATLNVKGGTIDTVMNSGTLNQNAGTIKTVQNENKLTTTGGNIHDLTNKSGTASLQNSKITNTLTVEGGSVSLNNTSVTSSSTIQDGATLSATGGTVKLGPTVSGTGLIKTTGGTLDLTTLSTNNFTGTFEQTGGTTKADSNMFFKKNNTIKGGHLMTSGSSLAYQALVKEGGTLSYENTDSAVLNIANNIVLEGANDSKGATINFINGKYQLSDMGSGTNEDHVNFTNTVVNLSGDFAGEKYTFTDSTLNMQDGNINTISFNNNLKLDETDLAFDVKLTQNANGELVLTSDKLVYNGDKNLAMHLDLTKVNLIDGVLAGGLWTTNINDSGLTTKTNAVQVLDGIHFIDTPPETAFVATDVYQYKVSANGPQSIQLEGIQFSDENSLNAVNTYEGNSAFNMAVGDGISNYKVGSDLDVMATGNKTVSGKNLNATESIIDASGDGSGLTMFKMDKEDSNLNVQNLTIQGAKDVLNASAGSATLDNVIVSSSQTGAKVTVSDTAVLKMKSVTLDQDIENTGTITAENSNIQNVTNANAGSFNAENTTIEQMTNLGTLNATKGSILSLHNQQGGNATLNEANVTASTQNAGEIVATDTSFNDVTNTGTLNDTKGSILSLHNQQGGKATLNEATVTGSTNNAGEIVATNATFNDVTNTGTLNDTKGSILSLDNQQGGKATLNEANVTGATQNAGEIVATDTSFDDVTNTGTLNATKGSILSLHNQQGGNATLNEANVTGSTNNAGEIVATNTAFNDVTNTGTLTGINTSIEELKNKGVATLTDSTIVAGSNENSLELINNATIKGDLNGDGKLTLTNATLNVKDGFETSNHVISNNATLGKDLTNITVGDLTVKENTTLDINRVDVHAQDVVLENNSTLGVELNGLNDFGSLEGTNLLAEEGSIINFDLKDDFESGLYHVLQMDSIESLPTAIYNNNKYMMLDMGDGRYSFMTTDKDEIADRYGSDDTQTDVIIALHDGRSDNNQFNKMQIELIEHLQSQNVADVNKAVKALDSLGSNYEPIIQTVTTDHFENITNAINKHMYSSKIKGLSGGDDEFKNASVWIEGIYNQVRNTQQSGFKIHNTGAILGAQFNLSDELTVGGGYSYGHADAKQEGRDTNISTNTIFAFAKYQPAKWFVDGTVSFSRAQYEEDKYILSSRGSADYNVDSFMLQAMGGYDFNFDGATITPKAGLRYINIKQEGYTDSFDTKVGNNDFRYLTAMFGVDFSTPNFEFGKIQIQPIAGIMLGYDIVSDDMRAINTLANGASYTVPGEALSKFSTSVRLGIDTQLTDTTELSVEYMGDYRSSHTEHGGMMKLKHGF